MAMARKMPDLGVSALLDELLAKEAVEEAKELAAAPAATPAAAAGGEREAKGAECARAAAEDEVSRQMAELCGEMDDCLSSLEKWQGEREGQKEALKAELAKKYGFGYDDEEPRAAPEGSERADGSSEGADPASLVVEGRRLEALAQDEEEEDGPDMCAQTISGGGAEGRRVEGLTVEGQGIIAAQDDAQEADSPSSRLQDTRDLEDEVRLGRLRYEIENAEEEARLARLRLEIEALRKRELEMGTAPFDLDDSVALDSSLALGNLAEWCGEVDAAVRAADCEWSFGATAGDEELLIGAQEDRLRCAQDNLAHMGDALDLARDRMDAEIKELEKMLQETDAVHARVVEMSQKTQN